MSGRKHMRYIQLVFVLLLACSINSCALVKTAYNNAPQALSWWLDHYFDFTRAQKAALNPALHRLHDWHRQQQLPTYVMQLQDIQNSLSQPQITPSLVCEKLDELSASFNQIRIESIPTMIEMAPLLSNQQLQYFEHKLDDRANDWKDDWWQDSPQEQLAVRLEKMQDYAEKIYGRLNQSQLDMLKLKLNEIPFKPALSYAEILRRHNDAKHIIGLLQSPSSSAELSFEDKSQLIKAGFERLTNSPNADYQRYADQHKQNICNTIAELHASTDSKQKQHAQNWLENYIVQFSQLSAIKPATSASAN